MTDMSEIPVRADPSVADTDTLAASELVAVGVSPVGVDRGVTLTLVLQDLARLWQLLLLESLLEHFLDLIRGLEVNKCSLLGL